MPGIADKVTSNGIPTIGDFFNTSLAEKIKNDHGAATIISSNNLVADTDELTQFIEDIKISNYLKSFLEKPQELLVIIYFDNICV